MQNFSFRDGGTVVQYYLAQTLDKMGQNVRIYSDIKTPNSIFSKFYANDFPINDKNTVVIYCEGTIGNPLKAKKVVRWMLSELGQNVPSTYLDTWNENELVYYLNSEKKFYLSPEKIGTIYKLLSVIYINPLIKNFNYGFRRGFCYTLRKAHKIHKGKKIPQLHPSGSIQITRAHTQLDYIRIFNSHKCFISYDSLTFLIIISALCGCIPVICKVEGFSKKDWIQTTVAAEYCRRNGLDNLYGIAYGIEDFHYAINTIHLVKQQWDDICNFSVKRTVSPFINDLDKFNKMLNTVENNF
jgi:hypothetical protein